MSKKKGPPILRVVNGATVGIFILIAQLIPYGSGDTPFGSHSNVGSVGIFIQGTSLASTSVGTNAIDQKCPRLCTCTGQTIDCSHRGLQQVPRKIPLDTERL